MTLTDFEKASEIMEKRDYYANLLSRVNDAIFYKNRYDNDAKERLQTDPSDHNAQWQLRSFFRIRLWNKEGKPKVGLLPHWNFAREIDIEAEPEIIELIQDWLKKKVDSYEEQIRQI